MIKGYLTVKEMADIWGINVRTVQIMCSENKIAGAIKFGRSWAIPVNTERPNDRRVITGRYRNWRKPALREKITA